MEDQHQTTPQVHQHEEPAPQSPRKLGTPVIIAGAVLLLVFVFGAYYFLGARSNTAEPVSTEQADVAEYGGVTAPAAEAAEGMDITVASPEHGAVVGSMIIAITGTTTPNADVFINDTELKADSSGNFTADLTLDEGENVISVASNDADGNYAEKEIMVVYVPEE